MGVAVEVALKGAVAFAVMTWNDSKLGYFGNSISWLRKDILPTFMIDFWGLHYRNLTHT